MGEDWGVGSESGEPKSPCCQSSSRQPGSKTILTRRTHTSSTALGRIGISSTLFKSSLPGLSGLCQIASYSRNSLKAPPDRLLATQARAGLLLVHNVWQNEPDAWLLRMLSPRCSCLPRSASNTPGYSPGFVRLFNEVLPIVSCTLPNASPSLPEGVYWQQQLYST